MVSRPSRTPTTWKFKVRPFVFQSSAETPTPVSETANFSSTSSALADAMFNRRCNQENLHAQLKGDVRPLTAPVDSLLSNWAYLVMASLAWSLKVWAALMLPEEGRWQERHREDKRKLLRMDFSTFRAALMNAQNTTGRRPFGRSEVRQQDAPEPHRTSFFRTSGRMVFEAAQSLA